VQILSNLISNAVKFTPAHGNVSVSVCEGRFEHAGTLVFKVKDTGCGTAAKDIDDLFERFIHADGGKAGKRKGWGSPWPA